MNRLGTLIVTPRLPDRIGRLAELASNLYWTWQPDARALFRALDEEIWEHSNHNPSVLLRDVAQASLDAAAADARYVHAYDTVLERFDSYLERDGWFSQSGPAGSKEDVYAYFCSEYGWHESLALYSGGLGVLAGDHTKAASDLAVPLVAVGLFYPEGYFHQRISEDGQQTAVYHLNEAAALPLALAKDAQGNAVTVSVSVYGREVAVRAWRTRVGRISVVLLDVDFAPNDENDRKLLARLYGGDTGTRIAQEIVLGVGGVRMLRALGVQPTSWHMNEGHSAFMALERSRELVAEGLDFAAAREAVTANTLFTVHTPVAAGNDAFGFDLVSRCFAGFWRELKMSEEEFLDLGRADHGWGDIYSMPALAIRFSSGRNGVAELHGDTSRHIWASLWKDVPVADVPIGHVTNGVHLATWMAPEMRALAEDVLGAKLHDIGWDAQRWQAFESVDPAKLWEARMAMKSQSVRFLRRRVTRQLERQEASPTSVGAGTRIFDPNVLTIGFARRFAAYKRATLIFRDLDRLSRLLNNEQYPVQLVFAGKAHPADQPGQALIATIHNLSKDPRFAGKVLFVEDYDMAIGRALTRGVDVWLNNPRRPLEASGTSGQKAAMNGILNLSVLDGWWPEGYNGENGWAIGGGRTFADAARGDAADADSLYDLLEREVVPLYYRRDEAGLPHGWIKRSAAAIASVAPRFSAERMVRDYVHNYYAPASARGREVAADGYAGANALAAWRRQVAAAWPQLVLTAERPEVESARVGDEIEVAAKVTAPGLDGVDIRVEVVYSSEEDQLQQGLKVVPMVATGTGPDGETSYAARFSPELSGRLAYGVRCYPSNDLLASPFDAHAIAWA